MTWPNSTPPSPSVTPTRTTTLVQASRLTTNSLIRIVVSTQPEAVNREEFKLVIISYASHAATTISCCFDSRTRRTTVARDTRWLFATWVRLIPEMRTRTIAVRSTSRGARMAASVGNFESGSVDSVLAPRGDRLKVESALSEDQLGALIKSQVSAVPGTS